MFIKQNELFHHILKEKSKDKTRIINILNNDIVANKISETPPLLYNSQKLFLIRQLGQ